jgi:hypothetical protein
MDDLRLAMKPVAAESALDAVEARERPQPDGNEAACAALFA